MTPRLGLLSGFLILLLFGSIAAAGQEDSRLELPQYSLNDRWEYLLDGRIEELLGLNNSTGQIFVAGLGTGRVTSVNATGAVLAWTIGLSLNGNLTFQTDDFALQASLTGSVETMAEERHEFPDFLPREVQTSTVFDLTLAALGVQLPYTATLEVTTSHTPDATFPSYPLSVGESTARFLTHVQTNFSSSIFGMEIKNQSFLETDTSLRLSVAAPSAVEVPAGIFEAHEVQADVLEGVATVPLQGLFPADRQVGYHANRAGNAVLLRFFLQGQLLGNATLRSFTYSPAAEIPFWQQPVFLLSLLAIPIVVLVYLYWRERRKGL